ncbi:MAG: alpha/beta hydrolase [Thermoplasmatota archaeon]|nr:alpha/beta hydrolase [Halobacteriales archaeon]
MEAVAFGVQGVRLHGEHHAPEGPAKGAVVLVHGFNSNLEEFGPAPAALAKAGFHALAFDQRGFGRSAGERGRTSKEMAVEDIAAATAWLRGMAGKAPLGILGHSLGGAYALAAAAELGLFRCAVVAHPVDTLFGELNALQRAGYHFMGWLGERRVGQGRPAGHLPYKVHYSEIFVSHEAAQAAKRDDILLKHANLANYRDALAVQGAVWARGVTVPVLCIASRHDRAVKPAHSRAVFDAIAGRKETFEHEGGHSCFRDLDGRRVIAAAVAWFGRELGGAK